MQEDTKLYTIESIVRKGISGGLHTQYRFRSLYNSCTGQWFDNKEKAVMEGESHQFIVMWINKMNNLV